MAPAAAVRNENKQQVPLLLPELGASWFLIRGEGRGLPEVGPEWCLWWFAHLFGCVVCRRQVQYSAISPDSLLLLPALQKWQLVFLVFVYFVVHNLPQLRMQDIFSPL